MDWTLPTEFCARRDEYGDVHMFDGENNRLNFKVLEYANQDDASFFNHYLLELSRLYNFISMVLPIFEIANDPNCYFAVSCEGNTRLSSLVAKKLFDDVGLRFFKFEKKKTERIFFSLLSKRMIWSIFRTVVACLDTPIRPILSLDKMFLSNESDVVFTEFQKRNVVNFASDGTPQYYEGGNFEAKQMKSFFNTLFGKKTRDPTLLSELKSFTSWLTSVDLSYLKNTGNMNEVLTNVLFWTDKMRISCVMVLHDYLEGGNSISLAKDAFKIHQNNDNWRTILESSNNFVLQGFLMCGDSFYGARMNQHQYSNSPCPSWRRSSILETNPEAVFEQGLTRMRDCYVHLTDFLKQIELHREQNVMKVTELQHLYQWMFPNHMVELAKMQYTCGLGVVNEVLQLLSTRSFPYQFD